MSNLFDIQHSSGSAIKLTETLQETLNFSVTNVSGFNMNARAQISPAKIEKWVTIDEPLRRIADSMTEQFTVTLAVPKGTVAGNYDLRLDIVDADHPDENFQQGPAIKFEVPATKGASVNYVPYIIAAVVAVVVLVVGIVAALILMKPAPNAEFTYAISETDSLEVVFSLLEPNEEAEYLWDFGDGNTTTGINPTYRYTSSGEYSVTVQVNEDASTHSEVISLFLIPVAGFSVNTFSGDAPLTVEFVNNSSGDIDSYAWDFNGDSTVDSTDAFGGSFTYTSPGIYNASLSVTGAVGEDTVTQSISVSQVVNPPIAQIFASQVMGNAPLNITFIDNSQGNVTSRAWDFNGDGTIDSTQSPAAYTYISPGTYTVELTVMGEGGESSTTNSITVSPENLVANFNFDPSTGEAPLTVNFSNTSVGNITNYAWDFNGDNANDSTEQNPSYTYSSAGTYNVKLIVSGPGGQAQTTRTLIVDAHDTTVSRFLGTWNNSAADGITRFTISESGSQLVVQMWGSCSPSDCDWGTTSTTASDAQDGLLTLTWDQGFVVRSQTLTYLDNGQIRLVSISNYTDARPTRTDTYFFSKLLRLMPIQELAPIQLMPLLLPTGTP